MHSHLDFVNDFYSLIYIFKQLILLNYYLLQSVIYKK